MKSYTDIEQSKVLAEILPLESVDMYYPNRIDIKYQGALPIEYKHGNPLLSQEIATWSLAALVEILSKSAYFANEAGIEELSSIEATKWCICILNCGRIGNCYADNPVDACVAMIETLNKLNLL